jgi:iron complex outermembrane receptor protein
LPTIIANTDKALSYGGEVSVRWDVVDRWRLGTSYSLLERSTTSTDAGILPRAEFSTDPRHAFQVDSRLNLPGHLEFDQWIWWTSRLAANRIPPYTRVDVRLGRRLGESAEISVNGQNLLRPRFLEFGDSFGFAGTANPRSIFAKVTWRF